MLLLSIYISELKEEVNIARVDVPANRDLGNRFALKGFPTLIFFAKGHMYPYPSSSPRTKDALINFIRGGYKTATSETVPGPSSWFDDFTYIFRESYKSAKKDYDAGNYFTSNILIVLLPLMLLVTIYIIASNTPAKVKYDSPNLATMLFPNKEGSKQKAAKKSD